MNPRETQGPQGLSFGKSLIFRVSLSHEDYLNLEQKPWAMQKEIFDEQVQQLESQLEKVGARLTQEFEPSSSSFILTFLLLNESKMKAEKSR